MCHAFALALPSPATMIRHRTFLMHRHEGYRELSATKRSRKDRKDDALDLGNVYIVQHKEGHVGVRVTRWGLRPSAEVVTRRALKNHLGLYAGYVI